MIDVELVILGVGIHHLRMPDHANIGKLFQECTALKDKLASDLGKNLNHKTLNVAVMQSHGTFATYPLVEGCMRELQDGDRIIYYMFYGD